MLGVAASGLGATVAQTMPGSSDALLQYGSAGVLGICFFTLIVAVAQGRFVSSHISEVLRRSEEREKELMEALADSRRREELLSAIVDRQMRN